MKNKILALLLMIIMITSLVGCSNTKNTNINDTTKTVSGNDMKTGNQEPNNQETDEWEVFITDEEYSMEDLVSEVELCEYSNIETNVTYKEITEDDITNEMNEYLSYFDSYEHLTEGTVENGQKVNVTFVGKIDGEEFDGGSGTFDLEIGSNNFIKEFEDGLIGMSVGDEITLNITFPEDYDIVEFQNKEAVFDVTINYILGEKISAELTDEYLTENTDYNTVEELYDAAKSYLESVSYNNYLADRENSVLDYLINNSKLPLIPRVMVENYINNMVNYYESIAIMYNMELSDFVTSQFNITEEEFRLEAKKSAINYIQSSLVLQSIANKEEIKVTEDDFNSYINEFAVSNGYSNIDELISALEENDEMDEMQNEVLYNKVMTFLYEKNNLTIDVPESILNLMEQQENIQQQIDTFSDSLVEENTEKK